MSALCSHAAFPPPSRGYPGTIVLDELGIKPIPPEDRVPEGQVEITFAARVIRARPGDDKRGSPRHRP